MSQTNSVKTDKGPASRAMSWTNSVKTGKASAKPSGYGSTTQSTPALMSAGVSSRSASSVLTNAITITNAQVPQAVKVKQETDATIYTYDGALSDHQETAGFECDVALASPVKGVLDTPPHFPTIPTNFQSEFGRIGWNLVGIDFQ